MCAIHASCINLECPTPDMGNCVRTIEVWNRLASSNNTEEEWITEFWALALQLERELQIAHGRMENMHRGSEFCDVCYGSTMIPSDDPNGDVMNTRCPKCNPRND